MLLPLHINLVKKPANSKAPKTKVFPQKEYQTDRDLGDHAFIYCPGCKGHHSLRIRMPANPTEQEIDDRKKNKAGLWTFNGDVERPTFSPSLVVFASTPERRCHTYIRDGNIQFLDDCYHDLKGRTVELPDIEL